LGRDATGHPKPHPGAVSGELESKNSCCGGCSRERRAKICPQLLPSLQRLVGIEGLKFEAWYITIRGFPAE